MESLKGGADESGRLENEVDETGEPKKIVRQRKRHIINKLRVQMEFYFSSSNLSKDRFMGGMLRNSPYIDLEIFFKFNRIRTLTDDLNLLKKAVEKSPLLELSVDGLKVKRVQEARMKENEVLCTIYVENVPSHVDHEWVYELFSQYGTIDYISFPRFKNTGRPKGFAFVEFQNPEMADKALEAFGAIGCKISPDMEPSQLQSICTNDNFGRQPEDPLGSEACAKGHHHHVQFEEGCESEEQFEEKDLLGDGKTDGEKRKRKEEGIENSKKVKLVDCEFGNEKTDGENVKTKKKKLKVDSEITEAPAANECATECDKKVDECGDWGEKAKGDKETKKRKMKTECDLENAIKRMRKEVDEAKEVTDDNGTESSETLNKRSADENGKEKKLKKPKVKADATNTSAEEEMMAVEETPSAKVKRKKKKKKRKRSKKEKDEALEGTSLKVMSKQQWTRLRNRYLNMQRANMGSLKFDLRERRYPQRMEYENYPTETSKIKGPKFTPDAVIKISFEEPPQDPKKLQEAIKEGGGGGVAYVETSAVEKDVYVRFISADSASAYIKAGLWSRMMLLSGEEEKEYWNHCASSWLEQRNKKNKKMKDTSHEYPNKIRGREKLLQKALREAQSNKPSSHVVFEG